MTRPRRRTRRDNSSWVPGTAQRHATRVQDQVEDELDD